MSQLVSPGRMQALRVVLRGASSAWARLSRRPALLAPTVLAAAAVLLAYPRVVSSVFLLHVVVIMLLYVPLAVGQNLITGNSGQVSMGHAAFYGTGAYIVAILGTKFPSVPSLALLGAAVLGTAALGLATGLPAIRVSGDYLFIVTMGLNLIFLDVVTQWQGLTRGAAGIPGVPVFRLGGWQAIGPQRFYYLALAGAAVVVGVAAALLSSRFGRAVEAVRDDSIAAETSGLNTTTARLATFAVGAAMAGLSGGLFAYYVGFVGPQNFGIEQSLIIFEMAIIGGLGSIPGSIFGAILLIAIPEVFRVLQDYRLGLGGLLVVLLMVFRPHGLLGRATIQPLVKR
jgi:branched-chain amino acid transport system permease protein